MNNTKKQKAAIKAIVACHETGRPVPNFSALVVLNDDAGVTFGAFQGTHKSGTLYKIVQMYCNISDSPVSKKLDKYLAGLKKTSLRHTYSKDAQLKSLLKEAGNDPIMRFAQNKVFEVNYFEPAARAVEGSGWIYPLSLAVVYDSMIQGSWAKLRDRTKAKTEKEWIKQYVANRRKWLSSSRRQVVRNSVYRMKTFEGLIANGNWNLDTPIPVHGVKITANHLAIWMAADTPTRQASESGEVAAINVPEPAENFYVSNTEGIAAVSQEHIEGSEHLEAGGSWEIDEDIKENLPENIVTDSIVTSDESNVTGDPPKAGEPAPDHPAKEGESIVGGRPQDSPIIVSQPVEASPSGWRTWPTTILATLSSVGVSITSAGAWFWGAAQDPPQLRLLLILVITGVVVAAGYGIFYLTTRLVTRNKEAQRAHEIVLKELEIRSMPDRYNVKLDRLGDVSNLTASGLAKIDNIQTNKYV